MDIKRIYLRVFSSRFSLRWREHGGRVISHADRRKNSFTVESYFSHWDEKQIEQAFYAQSKSPPPDRVFWTSFESSIDSHGPVHEIVDAAENWTMVKGREPKKRRGVESSEIERGYTTLILVWSGGKMLGAVRKGCQIRPHRFNSTRLILLCPRVLYDWWLIALMNIFQTLLFSIELKNHEVYEWKGITKIFL